MNVLLKVFAVDSIALERVTNAQHREADTPSFHSCFPRNGCHFKQ